ncbi:MAG: bifunctional ADP-dependent NAD(P)H-hydrate dehydratase/NAD(P)H-hydrate epimerase [Flavobacteriaceae bacterium]|nr:bifunctional ADP-dependent NAD(P)H-hydrate dehydratase/NAD(P)H-hydrate epimerase [Flavobacteriaceae bacterium]
MDYPLKILSVSQIRKADNYTIVNEPIKSIDLMERAADRCFKWITDRYDKSVIFYVFCGTGNNGGDGLAISRMLNSLDYKCKCYELELGNSFSEDYIINKKRLGFSSKSIKKIKDFPEIPKSSKTIIIDSILGTGVNRKSTGLIKDVISKINEIGVGVISIDIPSGLFSEDNFLNDNEGIINSNHILCFESPKLSFVLPENNQRINKFHVLDIGLNKDFIKALISPYYYITKGYLEKKLKQRKKFDHKGSFGHLLLVSGSKGMMGAAILASQGALKSGVGLLSVLSPKCGEHILQTSVSEATLEENDGENYLKGSYDLNYDCIGIGPGIGKNSKTKEFFISLLKKVKKPLVIDADALNIISGEKKLLDEIPNNSILTPHPKEFERIVGKWKSDIEKLQILRDFSKKYKLICVLKGANTSIALPDGRIFFNSTGNPGMATAGSGDILTGIIGSLLAQGYSPETSSKLGVFIHGMSGDFARDYLGEISMTASDIQDFISKAFKQMLDR